MPRYIDADKLKESLKELKAEGNNLKYVQGLQDAIDGYFPQIIDDEPTADVQPVKHGRWISTEELYYNGMTKCSCCNEEYYVEDIQNLQGDLRVVNYCPNCGSKNRMDGDGE